MQRAALEADVIAQGSNYIVRSATVCVFPSGVRRPTVAKYENLSWAPRLGAQEKSRGICFFFALRDAQFQPVQYAVTIDRLENPCHNSPAHYAAR
jgi:hypothetical protein